MSGGFFMRPHLAELCSPYSLHALQDYLAEHGHKAAAQRVSEVLRLMDAIGEIQHEMYGVWETADRMASGDDGPQDLADAVQRWERGDGAGGSPTDPNYRDMPELRDVLESWHRAESKRVELVRLGYKGAARRLAEFQQSLVDAARIEAELRGVLHAVALLQSGCEPPQVVGAAVERWRESL